MIGRRSRLLCFGYATVFAWAALPASILIGFSACAASEEAGASTPDARVIVPPDDAAFDASNDGGSERDASPVPCAVGNLCIVPVPSKHATVTALSGRSKDDVWASASDGLLMHWDGREWAGFDLDFSETFRNLFLTSDETWASAGRLVLRRQLDPASVRTSRVRDTGEAGNAIGFAVFVLSNGETYMAKNSMGRWTPLVRFDFETGDVTPTPLPILPETNEGQTHSFRAGFLVPDRAIWLVGDGAAVARYPISNAGDGVDGGGSALGTGVILPIGSHVDLLAAWAFEEHLFAAGRHGTIVHFDGREWTHHETGTTATLNALFGLSPSDIWAAGENGTVLHFDGISWSRVPTDGYGASLEAIWGSASDDVWIGGEERLFHWGPLSRPDEKVEP